MVILSDFQTPDARRLAPTINGSPKVTLEMKTDASAKSGWYRAARQLSATLRIISDGWTAIWLDGACPAARASEIYENPMKSTVIRIDLG